MAYQSTEMAEKLNNAMAGRNDVATNNADPIRQMQGQVRMPQQVVAGQEPAAGRYANYTAPPADDGINFARISRALSGLGAGIQGRGAEFSKGLREDRAQRQKLRQEALITDTMYSKRALDSGNMPSFLNRMESRIDAGIKMGMDMTDSVQLYNLARTDPEAAKAQVNEVYMNLVDRGLVKGRQQETTKITQMMINGVEHQVVIDGRGELVKDLGPTKPTAGSSKVLGAGEQLYDANGKLIVQNTNEDPTVYNKLFNMYTTESKDNTEDKRGVEKLIVALDAGGGAATETINSSLATVYGGNSRAIAELIRWQNLGNVPEKIENYISRLLTGGYSTLNLKEITDLTRSFSKHLNKERKTINARHKKLGKRFNVTPDYISDGVDMSQLGEDYMQMTGAQLLAVDLTALNPGALKAYSDALLILEGE